MKFWQLLSGSVLLVALAGCASSDRMMRISPFGGDQKADDAVAALSFDSREVNLWPLLYDNDAFTSILWPMIDADADGMAVRPFFNRDGDEYSILFPLCAWNPVNRDGWMLFCYWNVPERRYMLLPFFMQNQDDCWLLPAYWNDSTFGVAPFCRFDADGGYFLNTFWFRDGGSRYVISLPFYSYRADATDSRHRVLFGLLGGAYDNPSESRSYWHCLAALGGRDGDESYHAVLPLYYWQQRPEQRWLWTLPVVYGSGQTEMLNVCGPLFFRNDSPERCNIGSFPLFWYRQDKASDAAHLNVAGLFHRYRNEKERETFTAAPFPFLMHWEDPAVSRWISFPLFWSQWNKQSDAAHLNVAGLFHRYRNEKERETFTAAPFPFLMHWEDPAVSRWISFPLFWSQWNKQSDAAHLNVAGLFHRYRNEKERETFTAAPFPFLMHWEDPAVSRWISFPLFWRSHSKNDGKNALNVLGILGNYEYDDPENWSLWSFPLFAFGREGAKRSGWGLWPLFRYDENRDGRSEWRLWPLISRRDMMPSLLNVDGDSWSVIGSLVWRSGVLSENRSALPQNDAAEDDWPAVPGGKALIREEGVQSSLLRRTSAVYRTWNEIALGDGLAEQCKQAVDTLEQLCRDAERLASLRQELTEESSADSAWLKRRVAETEKSYDENRGELRALLYQLGLDCPVVLTEPWSEEAPELLNRWQLADEFQQYTREITVESCRVPYFPFLYDSERCGANYHGRLLGVDWRFLGISSEWALWRGWREGEQEETRLARYFYWYRRNGEVERRIFFPGCSYTTENDDWQFSFWWRLASFRRKADKMSGYLFFIPFGKE